MNRSDSKVFAFQLRQCQSGRLNVHIQQLSNKFHWWFVLLFFFFRLEIWVESVIQLQWCKMTFLWMRGSEKKNVSVYSNIAEIVILKTMLKCHKRMCNMILKFTTIDQTNVYLGISSILRIKRIGVLGWCDFVVLSNEQSNNGYRT